jgi:hypothetical protein
MTILEQVLVDVGRFLSENEIPYMIIGGMANAVWGQPRATLDIDATIWVEDKAIEGIVSRLSEEFRLLVPDPGGFIRETHVLPLEAREGVRVDLIFGTLPYEREAIDRARVLSVAGSPVHFCAPEDLILHKIISERDQDLADARGVARRQMRNLDVQYLEMRIRELAQVLERPEIWGRWQEWTRGDGSS